MQRETDLVNIHVLRLRCKWDVWTTLSNICYVVYFVSVSLFVASTFLSVVMYTRTSIEISTNWPNKQKVPVFKYVMSFIEMQIEVHGKICSSQVSLMSCTDFVSVSGQGIPEAIRGLYWVADVLMTFLSAQKWRNHTVRISFYPFLFISSTHVYSLLHSTYLIHL